jgi:DNA-binding MarR family transcriptional regulator/GNAT superfamily N-acetyltransferase
MKDAHVSRVRGFNRSLTRTIGVLDDRYLGRSRPLAEARLIFEIGKDGAEIKDLRARLGLDSGYLSRLLRSLEKQGLATTPQAMRDKRVRQATLTRSGMSELRELNRRSDALAQSMLDPLSQTQKTRLVEAMVEVERLLSLSAVRIDAELPTSRDAEFCLGEYYRELALRFDCGFDPAQSLSPTTGEFAPPHGVFLVMRLNGRTVGCGAFKSIRPGAAYLKRMWVKDSVRGLGLGKRLLQALEDRARSDGHRVACLETNKTLVEARKLYIACGYREVAPFNDEPYAHYWFEKPLS